MKKRFLVVLTGLMFLLLTGCPAQKKIVVNDGNTYVDGNYTLKTECLGVNGDGSQTLKAWGNGRNRYEAVEQAKKNALRDVLFKGILNGKSDCDPKPIVTEVNAQVKYESYFNNFFFEGGDYQIYVQQLENPFERVYPDRTTVTYSVILKVQKSELKQRMITDGILQ
jgi:hypothetical protein